MGNTKVKKFKITLYEKNSKCESIAHILYGELTLIGGYDNSMFLSFVIYEEYWRLIPIKSDLDDDLCDFIAYIARPCKRFKEAFFDKTTRNYGCVAKTNIELAEMNVRINIETYVGNQKCFQCDNDCKCKIPKIDLTFIYD